VTRPAATRPFRPAGPGLRKPRRKPGNFPTQATDASVDVVGPRDRRFASAPTTSDTALLRVVRTTAWTGRSWTMKVSDGCGAGPTRRLPTATEGLVKPYPRGSSRLLSGRTPGGTGTTPRPQGALSGPPAELQRRVGCSRLVDKKEKRHEPYTLRPENLGLRAAWGIKSIAERRRTKTAL